MIPPPAMDRVNANSLVFSFNIIKYFCFDICLISSIDKPILTFFMSVVQVLAQCTWEGFPIVN